MYKNILLAIIIAIITGCSAPKPEQAPIWYTNIPDDAQFFYAVGASDTVDKAKKVAISSLRDRLSSQVNQSLTNKNHSLLTPNENIVKEIISHNTEVSKKLSLESIRIIKSKKFKGEELVLISIPRLDIFNKLKIILDAEYSRTKQEYEARQNLAPIKRFVALDSLIKGYIKIASLVGYNDFLISTYTAAAEYKFLNNMISEYEKLRLSINIYVLTDANSRIFASSVKNAIVKKGLSTNNSIEGDNALKLLITSQKEESMDYSFYKSKSLVKFTTYDKEKTKPIFRQHTFVGKSRKDYKDAKQQSAINLKYRIDKLGIFDFIGIKK